jgi:hypothetical protein
LVLGLAVGLAGADEQPVDMARQSYAKAEQAMKQGDFAVAAAEYASVYERTKDPALLLKIGVAKHKAGDCHGALAHYNRYLNEGSPGDALRAEIRERIDACQAPADSTGAGAADLGRAGPGVPAQEPGHGRRQARPAAAGAEPAATAAEPTEQPAGGLGAAGQRPPSFMDQRSSPYLSAAWLSVGVSFTLLTGGAILAMSASSREEDIRYLIEFRYPDGAPAVYAGTTRERYDELAEEGERAATYSRVMFGAAGLAAAAAGVFFALDARHARDAASPVAGSRARVVPMASSHGIGIRADWRF